MPLYEYKCLECKRHTEKIQKFSDPEITICPTCGGTLERVISAPAIAFKGGGWYADGYGNAKPSTGASKAEGAPAASDAKPESKPSGGSDANSPSTPAATPAPVSAAPAAATSSDSK